MIYPADNHGIVRQIIFPHEGWPAFTDDPNDAGGPTKGGITLPALSAFLGRQATIDELRALPDETAVTLYERNYIVRCGFNKITSIKLRTAVVDMAVLFGQTGSEVAIEQAAFVLENANRLPHNGVIDDYDAAVINQQEPRALINRLSVVRIKHHADVVHARPDQVKYLRGWDNRACEFIE